MGDSWMNESNGSTPGIPAAPSAGDGADYLDSGLRVLAEKLERRGLETQLVTYPVDGVKGEYYDALQVANPASPERGEIHVEKDGCVTWEYPGSLDDAGINKIADEAINALRATGVPRQAGTSW
jgi:hypothetical protein